LAAGGAGRSSICTASTHQLLLTATHLDLVDQFSDLAAEPVAGAFERFRAMEDSSAAARRRQRRRADR
jgi:hypothetical protein